MARFPRSAADQSAAHGPFTGSAASLPLRGTHGSYCLIRTEVPEPPRGRNALPLQNRKPSYSSANLTSEISERMPSFSISTRLADSSEPCISMFPLRSLMST